MALCRMDRLAKTLMRPINPAVIVVLGIYTVVWGLWIMAPWWTVFPHAVLYSTMAKIASEYVWGSIAICCGLITIRGATKPIYWNLDIGSLVGALFWLTVALLYFIGDAASTGGITSLTFAIYSGLIWLNVRTNKEYYGYDESFFHSTGK